MLELLIAHFIMNNLIIILFKIRFVESIIYYLYPLDRILKTTY